MAAMPATATTGAAGDRNAILLHGDFQCRLGVAACGAAPAPFVVTSAGEIEACRCFGSDVEGADPRRFDVLGINEF